MLSSSLTAVVFAALVSATPASKRIDRREWINLKATYGFYEEKEICVGLPPIADSSYLGGAFCGTGNASVSDLTTIIASYGVGRSGLLELPKYNCPTSTGADLEGGSNIPVVDCDIYDENQFWTIQANGTVTNDATGTCLTFERKEPSAPLTLHTCNYPDGLLHEAQLFFYEDVSA